MPYGAATAYTDYYKKNTDTPDGEDGQKDIRPVTGSRTNITDAAKKAALKRRLKARKAEV